MKKVKLLLLFLFWIIPFCFIACSDDEVGGGNGNDDDSWIDVTASSANWDGEKRADISYQLLVYSFADSDGDKCGDIRGLITKLDYLADELQSGVPAENTVPLHLPTHCISTWKCGRITGFALNTEILRRMPSERENSRYTRCHFQGK